MSYYFSKTLKGKSIDEAIENLSNKLKDEGFGILSEIDMSQTFKNKLNVDFKKYKILGACNPPYAYKALTNEDKIGVFLPCNIVVQENENGDIEVTAVDPVASMIAVKNENMASIALEIQQKIKNVIKSLD